MQTLKNLLKKFIARKIEKICVIDFYRTKKWKNPCYKFHRTKKQKNSAYKNP
mgnify:CR=1 FL=1